MIKAIILDVNGVIRFRNKFGLRTVINNELIKFVMNLQPKVKIGIITNVVTSSRKKLSSFEFFPKIDSLIISSEVRLRKPAKEIYELAVKELGIKHNECIFIDDKLINIKGAENTGMKGIQYKNLIQVMADVKKCIKDNESIIDKIKHIIK